jgi:uncharacterized metal-binding protein
MRATVVVCGANGERSVILERAVEEFAKKYFDRVIQFSACTVAVSPIIVQMSGGEPAHMVAVNGCKNRCAELILKKAGMSPKASIVLDEAVDRPLGKCENCTRFEFPDITEEEWKRFAELMGKAVESVL